MKNMIKRIGIGIGAAVILLGATSVFSEPGSESDPLVTLSYVEKKIEQVKYYVDEKIKNANNGNQSTSWEVVEVQAGESLICGDGTEMILRAGEAKSISKITVVTNSSGKEEVIDNGLTDVTSGRDLGMDEQITANHLLIIPRDDGRGAKAVKKSFFLVKGKYEIQ